MARPQRASPQPLGSRHGRRPARDLGESDPNRFVLITTDSNSSLESTASRAYHEPAPQVLAHFANCAATWIGRGMFVSGKRLSIRVSICDQTWGSHSIAVCPLNRRRLYQGYA
jgi:hypothetical protein